MTGREEKRSQEYRTQKVKKEKSKSEITAKGNGRQYEQITKNIQTKK